MFETDVEPDSPNEGARLRGWGTGIASVCKIDDEVAANKPRMGLFKTDDEVASPKEGAYLRCMMNRNRQTRGRIAKSGGGGRGVLKIYGEPASPNQGPGSSR